MSEYLLNLEKNRVVHKKETLCRVEVASSWMDGIAVLSTGLNVQ